MSAVYVFQSRDLSFDNVSSHFAEMQQWLSRQQEKELVIDYSLVKYIDSAGIAMLIELKKIAEIQAEKKVSLMTSSAIKQLMAFYSVEKLLD